MRDGGEIQLMWAAPALVKNLYLHDFGQQRADAYVQARSAEETGLAHGLDVTTVQRAIRATGKDKLSSDQAAALTAASREVC